MREDLFLEIFGSFTVWRVLRRLCTGGSGTKYWLSRQTGIDRGHVRKALYPLVAVGLVLEEKQPVYSKKRVLAGPRITGLRAVYSFNQQHPLAGKLSAVFKELALSRSTDVLGVFASGARLRVLLALARSSVSIPSYAVAKLASLGNDAARRHLTKLVEAGLATLKVFGVVHAYSLNSANTLALRLVDLFEAAGLFRFEVSLSWRDIRP